MKRFWAKSVCFLCSEKQRSVVVPDPQAPAWPASLIEDRPKTPELEPLCQACQGMTMEGLTNREEGYRHIDFWKLSDSSKDCAICELIALKLLESAESVSDNEEDITDLEFALEIFKPHLAKNGYVLERPCRIVLEVYPSGSLGYRALHIGGEFKESPDFKRPHEHATFPVRMSLGRLYLHEGDSRSSARPLIPRSDDSKMLAHLSRLVLQKLPFRTAEDSIAPLPTRVLDLGYFPESTLESPQSDLRLVNGASQQAPYMTLSYCWGAYTACRLLTGNLADRKERIRFEDLPIVFQQAIIFTRALKVRFLWIDALCIVQDDIADWEREAAQMANVYSRACCRLAATNSRRPTEPFWPPKPIVPSVQVPNLKDFYSGSKANGMYITLPKYYHNDVERGLLNKRGWVLQERLLAPTSIHFTKDHVYYEDGDTIVGEDGIARDFTWLSCINKTSQSSRLNLYPEKRPRIMGNYNANDSGEDAWLKIAELFSECQLSYQTDKLLALAGIVESKQGPAADAAHRERNKSQYTGSNYLVGLWETELHIDLIWTARGDKNLIFLDSLRLPSWSWLAYEGPITFTKDRRSLRENDTALGEPRSEIKLIDHKVVGFSELLPAKQQSYMVLAAAIRSPFTVSDTYAAAPSKFETKEEYFARSPFHHDPESSTNPLQLPSLSKCREIHGATDSAAGAKPQHIGFLSFDDDTRSLRSEELVLAHVSTLLDGLGPIFRAGAPSAIGFHGRSGPSSLQPILAYALVLRNTIENEYERVGVAEVNYDWMAAGTETTIKLI